LFSPLYTKGLEPSRCVSNTLWQIKTPMAPFSAQSRPLRAAALTGLVAACAQSANLETEAFATLPAGNGPVRAQRTASTQLRGVAPAQEVASSEGSPLPLTALAGGVALGAFAASRKSNRRAAPKPTIRRVATVDVKTEESQSDEMAGLGGGGGGGFGGFTGSNTAARRVSPSEKQAEGRPKVKIVYVVLESQYQASMTSAVKQINRTRDSPFCAECVGYLLEEIRNPATLEELRRDMADANIFVCSLIFVQELAEKLAAVVAEYRDTLDACLCFPSMPEIMKLNKLGTFDLTKISGGPLGNFAQQIKDMRNQGLQEGKPAAAGGAFQDSLLKLVRTLPKVLKFLPGEQANDARAFVLSLQHWLGGTPENLEAMLMRVAGGFVPTIAQGAVDIEKIMDPVVLPDQGIWHPLAPQITDTMAEYNEWYEKVHMPLAGIPKDAPVVGVILQKSHISTDDAGHYIAFIQEIERRGARVVAAYTGALDFSAPVTQYFMNGMGKAQIDVLVNLTGFSLVGGPASQDAKKAKAVLMKLNRPYLVSVPLVFQSFTEWQNSQLGLHPVQVALQVSLPEIDGAIEPLIFSGRDGTSGRSIPMQDRISNLATRALNWTKLRQKKNADKKVCICLFQFPPDKGNVGTAAYLDVFGSIYAVMEKMKADGYTIDDLPADIEALQKSILEDPLQQFSMADLNVEYRMSVDEYERLCPYAEDLRENWGPPPGSLNTDGQNLRGSARTPRTCARTGACRPAT